MKSNLKNLLFSVLAGLILMAGLEAGLRAAEPGFLCRARAAVKYNRITFQGITPELYDDEYINTILDTKEIPLFRGKNERWIKYMEQRNSKGFRGPEFSENKPEGILRIICLGDSITWDGWYIQEMTKRLKIKSPEKNIEIINCGLPGRPSMAGLNLFMREIKAYEPDILILGFAINDANLHQTERAKEKKYMSSRWVRVTQRGLNSIYIYLALKAAVWNIKDMTFDPLKNNRCDTRDRFSTCNYRENLEALIREAQKQGIRLIFFTSHSPFYYHELERYNRVMKAVAQKRYVPVLDVRQAMIDKKITNDELENLKEKADKNFAALLEKLMGRADMKDKVLHPTYIFYYDFFHPNRKGHEIIGRKLAELTEI